MAEKKQELATEAGTGSRLRTRRGSGAKTAETAAPRKGNGRSSAGNASARGKAPTASADGTRSGRQAADPKVAPPKALAADRGAAAKGAAGGKRAGPRTSKPDLRKDLRDFASARPEGWGHEDWLAFLEDLQSRGHNVNDREEIGRALERERLDLALSRIKGLGPQRRQGLVEKYGNIWGLRSADPDEIASSTNIPRDLAGRLKSELA